MTDLFGCKPRLPAELMRQIIAITVEEVYHGPSRRIDAHVDHHIAKISTCLSRRLRNLPKDDEAVRDYMTYLGGTGKSALLLRCRELN